MDVVRGGFCFRISARMSRRNYSYRSKWGKLLEIHGSLCFYCQKEPAMCIDHIIPVSYGGKNDFNNLVPACAHCNMIVSDNVFSDVWSKQQWILAHRKKKLTHALCTGCLLPFAYRIHSPSMFLCAECYDNEYDTKHKLNKEWKEWLKSLTSAGYSVDSHRESREEISMLDPSRKHREYSYMILHKYMALSGYFNHR